MHKWNYHCHRRMKTIAEKKANIEGIWNRGRRSTSSLPDPWSDYVIYPLVWKSWKESRKTQWKNIKKMK